MLLDDDFISAAADDPVPYVITAINKMRGSMDVEEDWTQSDFEKLVEIFAFIRAMDEADLIHVDIFIPELQSDDFTEECRTLSAYIAAVQDSLAKDHRSQVFMKYKDAMSEKLSRGFAYQFSSGDTQRVQVLINELREYVSASELFEDSHRARILKRLEQLQAELHKRKSDLDRFWGLIGDAGVAIGKFGSDAKPFVDRITEISQIVWNTQKQTEGLPSNTELPLLSGRTERSELSE